MEEIYVTKVVCKDTSSKFYCRVTACFSDKTSKTYKIYCPSYLTIGSFYRLNVGIVPYNVTFKSMMGFQYIGCHYFDSRNFEIYLRNKVREYMELYYKLCDRTDDPYVQYMRSINNWYNKESYNGKIEEII